MPPTGVRIHSYAMPSLATGLILCFICIGLFVFSASNEEESYEMPKSSLSKSMNSSLDFSESLQMDGINETDYLNVLFSGRDNDFVEDTRQEEYPLNHHYSNKDKYYNDFSSLLSYFRRKRRKKKPSLHKRRKHHLSEAYPPTGLYSYQHVMPLFLTAMAKVANFIPVIKLTLLALFALVLFSKKAFLVSLGSLILVIYDTFYAGKLRQSASSWGFGGSNNKNVQSSVQTELHNLQYPQSVLNTQLHGVNTHLHLPAINPQAAKAQLQETENPYYSSNGALYNPYKINAQVLDPSQEKRRWWAPQINMKKRIGSAKDVNNVILKEKEWIYENIDSEGE